MAASAAVPLHFINVLGYNTASGFFIRLFWLRPQSIVPLAKGSRMFSLDIG